MMMILLIILVLGGYALYTMSPEERTTLKERLVATALHAKEEAGGGTRSPNRSAMRCASGPPGRS